MDTVTSALIEYGRLADLDRVFSIKRSTAYAFCSQKAKSNRASSVTKVPVAGFA